MSTRRRQLPRPHRRRIRRLRASARKALIPFVTAGDPDAAHTVPLMHALVEAGADVIELGVPFSDPMADGPVDPARLRARAEARRRACATCSTCVARIPQARRDDAGRADGLRQSDRAHGRRALRRRARRRPASTACSSSTIRPRRAATFAGAARARAASTRSSCSSPTSTDARIEQVGASRRAATSTTSR